MSLRDYKLILGGGGARGFAHLGVINTLHKIKEPKKIAGCSMGGVVASLYALYKDPVIVQSKIDFILNKTEFKRIKIDKFSKVFSSLFTVGRLFRKRHLIKAEVIMRLLEDIIPKETEFSDLKIPLELVCFDMKSGRPIVLKEGRLIPAIVASASIPGIIEPVESDDKLLTDGGVYGSVPFFICDDDLKNIVVDVTYDPPVEFDFSNALEFFYKTVEWQIYFLEKEKRNAILKKDVLVLEPPVKRYTLKNFFNNSIIIEKGLEYSTEKEQEIKSFLKKGFFYKMKKFLKHQGNSVKLIL